MSQVNKFEHTCPGGLELGCRGRGGHMGRVRAPSRGRRVNKFEKVCISHMESSHCEQTNRQTYRTKNITFVGG